MVPLETRRVIIACFLPLTDAIVSSDPHPFISLIAPSKGKRLLPRISRHLSSQQMLTVLTLLVACFSQMDIILHAHILDLPEENTHQQDLERQTQAFLGSVIQSILPVVAKAGLRLVSGLLGLLLERSDIVSITQTRVCCCTIHQLPPADRLPNSPAWLF
jgi:DNA topoisomerase 2-associated protein PAT1